MMLHTATAQRQPQKTSMIGHPPRCCKSLWKAIMLLLLCLARQVCTSPSVTYILRLMSCQRLAYISPYLNHSVSPVSNNTCSYSFSGTTGSGKTSILEGRSGTEVNDSSVSAASQEGVVQLASKALFDLLEEKQIVTGEPPCSDGCQPEHDLRCQHQLNKLVIFGHMSSRTTCSVWPCHLYSDHASANTGQSQCMMPLAQ